MELRVLKNQLKFIQMIILLFLGIWLGFRHGWLNEI